MKKIIRRFFIVLCILLVVDIMATRIWFWQNSISVNNFSEKNMDVAIVFMGDFGKNSDVGNETMRRINHASKLYRKGLINNIICVGGNRPKRDIFGADDMKKIFVNLGISAENIWTERTSNDSKTNWKMAYDLMYANNWHNAYIISSPVHIPRLKQIILSKNLNIVFLAYPYRNCEPKITFPRIWLQMHHEWCAFLANAVLSKSAYRSLINRMRQ